MIKECLITVGATAKFTELISAGLSQDCLQTLADNGFTHLNVQYGDSEELFNSLRTATTTGEKPISIKITGFGFDKDGLGKQIAQCQRNPGTSEQGLVICHAGMAPAHFHPHSHPRSHSHSKIHSHNQRCFMPPKPNTKIYNNKIANTCHLQEPARS